jgi:predicted amidohydrolase
VSVLPRGPLRVAAIQAEPVPADLAGNAATAARLVTEAGRRGARLAVLPELFLPAYHPPTLEDDPAGTDLAAGGGGGVDDARLDPLRAACRDAGLVAVVGAAVRYPDHTRTCSVLVLGADGSAGVGYDKQHLWGPDERRLFSAGTRGATLMLDGWHLGLGICYDGCFPEHARAAALAGAHGYLCPSAYLRGSEHRRDLYYAARALDNTCYVVFANVAGGRPPWCFNGGAAVYEPQGRALGRAADEGEAVVVADLSPDALAATRADHGMLVDRRADLGDRRFVALPPATS